MQTKRRARLNQQAVNIHALLKDREFIKVTAFLLSRATKAQVLEMMERLRRARLARRLRASPDRPLPEMTDGELLREINWRIGTLPPGDAETVARYIRHLTRWHTERRRRAALEWRRQGLSAP